LLKETVQTERNAENLKLKNEKNRFLFSMFYFWHIMSSVYTGFRSNFYPATHCIKGVEYLMQEVIY